MLAAVRVPGYGAVERGDTTMARVVLIPLTVAVPKSLPRALRAPLGHGQGLGGGPNRLAKAWYGLSSGSGAVGVAAVGGAPFGCSPAAAARSGPLPRYPYKIRQSCQYATNCRSMSAPPDRGTTTTAAEPRARNWGTGKGRHVRRAPQPSDQLDSRQ